MRPDHPLRRLFRAVSIPTLLFIGAVLFLFPEPFTTVVGMILIMVAVVWLAWSRSRLEPDSDTSLLGALLGLLVSTDE
ncbi:hypothetical protein [Halorussus sp. AFM4]|uniref:hypothetical protein n=1 Tax=Halorussus sp. AFM4 TaxID=3421651 RepID=UPI003EBA8232